MVCERCGKPLPSTGFICSNCGSFMTKEQVETQKRKNAEKKVTSPNFISQKYAPDKALFLKREENNKKNYAFLLGVSFILFLFIIILIVYLF